MSVIFTTVENKMIDFFSAMLPHQHQQSSNLSADHGFAVLCPLYLVLFLELTLEKLPFTDPKESIFSTRGIPPLM
jgi:hypothetical protein